MKSSHLLLILFCLVLFSAPSILSALTVDISAHVPGCGDGAISSGEQCDGANLGGSVCTLQGFVGGTLSCTSACTYNTSQCILPSANGNTSTVGGGGGGGGAENNTNSPSPIIPNTNVVLSGRAYPLSRVSVLKDGQLVVTTIAGPDSNFTATISGLSTGNYTFAVYGEDKNDVRSSLFTFPMFISSGVTTKIGDIFIAPTISVDKSEVSQGDNISIFGQSTPSSEITISVHSNEEFFVKKTSDTNGVYLLNFDTSVLEMGQHNTKSKAAIKGEVSSFGKVVGFTVGSKTVLAEIPAKVTVKGDMNGDKKVNLVDFSVAAYWYKRPNPPATSDLNKDGKVDLTDFSIMAFNWTG